MNNLSTPSLPKAYILLPFLPFTIHDSKSLTGLTKPRRRAAAWTLSTLARCQSTRSTQTQTRRTTIKTTAPVDCSGRTEDLGLS